MTAFNTSRPPQTHVDHAATNLIAEDADGDVPTYQSEYEPATLHPPRYVPKSTHELWVLTSSSPPLLHTEVSAATLTSEHDFDTDHHHEEEDLVASPAGRRMRRYVFRTVVGIFGPIIVLCYLIVIWQIYLVPVDPDSPVSFGPPGAKWIFYSWFVAGIIGLNLSLYGLAGAEAGMLMEPFWRVNDAMGLMLHADNTWSGPGGWMKAIKWTIQVRRGKTRSRRPGRLWFVLALPSVVVFTAWPLSGLCLEMTSGFMRDSSGEIPTVTGFVWSDFNAIPGGRSPSKKPSSDTRVPGFGAIYTPQGFDRSSTSFLNNLPAILPNNEDVAQIFLTAQSESPIEGKAWGLQVQYECSIVTRKSDLRLLSGRKSAMEVWESTSVIPSFAWVGEVNTWEENLQNPPPTPTHTGLEYTGPEDTAALSSILADLTPSDVSLLLAPYPTPNDEEITKRQFPVLSFPASSPTPTPGSAGAVDYDDKNRIRYKSYRINDNTTLVEVRKEPQGLLNGLWDLKEDKWSLNLDAVMETAYETLLMPNTKPVENPCTYQDRQEGDIRATNNAPTGYCYYNMDHDRAQNNSKMEQSRVFEVLLWQGLGSGTREGFNASLYNSTIDHLIPELEGEYTSDRFGPLKAVGVTCTSSSSVGTADVNGLSATFSNFVRSDTPIPNRRGECARRLGAETLACTLRLQEREWLKWLFDSVGAPLPIDEISASDPTLIEDGWRSNAQLAYLQASQLRQSLLQTFSSYAIKLMYNDGRDFVGPDGGRLKKDNGNVTSFVAGTVITRNVIPASVPIALFGIWAFISSGVCLVYGFRRRWSAILDGHTVFRLGVELKDGHKAKLQQHSTLAEIDECIALHEVPGFVGDVDHSNHAGRIGLVDGRTDEVFAKKKRFYR